MKGIVDGLQAAKHEPLKSVAEGEGNAHEAHTNSTGASAVHHDHAVSADTSKSAEGHHLAATPAAIDGTQHSSAPLGHHDAHHGEHGQDGGTATSQETHGDGGAVAHHPE